MDQKQQINDAVYKAELGTSAEIVPAVVTMSGRYDRPEDIVGLWVGAIAFVIVWASLPIQNWPETFALGTGMIQ